METMRKESRYCAQLGDQLLVPHDCHFQLGIFQFVNSLLSGLCALVQVQKIDLENKYQNKKHSTNRPVDYQ